MQASGIVQVLAAWIPALRIMALGVGKLSGTAWGSAEAGESRPFSKAMSGRELLATGICH